MGTYRLGISGVSQLAADDLEVWTDCLEPRKREAESVGQWSSTRVGCTGGGADSSGGDKGWFGDGRWRVRMSNLVGVWKYKGCTRCLDRD